MYQVFLFKFRRHLCRVSITLTEIELLVNLHHNAKAKWRFVDMAF